MAVTVAPPAASFIGGNNPLNAHIAQFLLQLVVIVTVAKIVGYFLKKLNQPAVIAEVIGGLILGPTVMSRIPGFKETIFPSESMESLKLVADIGLMFYLFIVGMELDPIKLATAFKKAAGISLAGITLPFATGVGVSKALYDQYMTASDPAVSFTTFFIFCGVAMSITAFPVLARILSEQNLMNTPVGEISMAAAGADDAVVWCMLILVVSLINNPSQQLDALYVFFIVLAFGVFLWLCIRPIFLYLIDKSEHENGADQLNITVIFLTMVCCAFFTQAAGVDTIFGAFLCGLIVPHERGFAIALTEKLEDLICIMFLPLYFGYAGLNVNLAKLDNAVAWGYVVLVIFVACAGKIIGCSLAALASKVPLRESLAIGILMNTKGLVELIVLNLGLQAGVITEEVYSIFVIMALVTTLMTVPIINWFYPAKYHNDFQIDNESETRPSLSCHRQSDDHTNVRLLTCLTSMRTVPAMMSLHQILSKGRASGKKIDMYALRLKVLDARYSSIMNASESNEQLSTIQADPVMNVFRTFDQVNSHATKIVMVIATHAHFAEEIAQASIDVDASFVIFPIETTSTTYPSGWGKTVSNELFASSKAPACALFVDRGFGASATKPAMESKAAKQSLKVFAALVGNTADVQILSLLEIMSLTSNLSITIVVSKKVDVDSIFGKMLESLSSASNVTVRHEESDDRGQLYISESSILEFNDLVIVSFDLYSSSASFGFGNWLDHECKSSFMVVKAFLKSGGSDESSSMTIATISNDLFGRLDDLSGLDDLFGRHDDLSGLVICLAALMSCLTLPIPMLLDLLQTELTTLSTEAKKKGIENAAEKLLFNLKKIKNDGSDVVVELEKSSETMIPFMLSFESKQGKLISISVGCILRLISQNAVPQLSLASLLTFLSSSDSAMSVMEVQFKILQILLPFCTNYCKVVHGELLSSCLELCYKYSSDTKQPILSNTASATFRQMILHVFERMEQDEEPRMTRIDSSSNDLSVTKTKSCFTSFYKRDGLALFHDFCAILNGESALFVKKMSPSMPKLMALELIESILSSYPKIFLNNSDLLALIKDKICPNLIRFFSEKTEYPMMVRLVRTVKVIVKLFTQLLPMECEIFLTLFCKILETSQYLAWQRILILEFLKGILGEPGLQKTMFHTFDKTDHSVNIYADIVSALSIVTFDARNYLFFYSNPASPGSSQPGDEIVALSCAIATVKMPCLEQMEKAEPPSFPDAYPILLSFQCLVYIVEQQSDLLPRDAVDDINSESESKDHVLVAIEMAKASASDLFYALSIFLVSSIDEDLFGKTLKAISKYTIFLGKLGLVSLRDAFLFLLCKTTVSAQLPMQMENWKAIPKSVDLMTFSCASASKSLLMSDKSMMIFACLLNTCEELTDVMDSKTWFLVLDTISVIESLIQPKAQFRKMDSVAENSQGLSPTKELPKPKVINTSNLSFMEAYSVRVQNVGVDFLLQNSQYTTQSKHLFELTTSMKSKPFMEFIRALCRLAHESTMFIGTSNTTTQTKEKSADEKNFAITKLQDICLMNINRIVSDDDTFFDLVSQQLINLSQIPNCPSSIRSQACFVLGEILLSASQESQFTSNEVIELRLLEAIRILMAFENHLDNNELVPEQNDQSIARLPFLVDIRKQGLEIINKLLQRSGQNIKAGWLVLLETIYFVVQSSSTNKKTGTELDSAINAKNAQLIRVGFPSVQLICTDFMSSLSPMGLSRCIQTVSAFGTFAEDLNISLTSVGLLWSLCDFILTKRQKLEKIESETSDENQFNLPNSPFKKGSLLNLSLLSGPLNVMTMDTLWMYLLRNLSELCSDFRPEVRNSANQTLFRTLSTNGQRLTIDLWDLCLGHVLFPLLDRIKSSAPDGNEVDKNWDETKILTLNGITKSITDFLPVLIQLEERFDHDWKRFLEYMKNTCLTSSQEVSLATLKCFRTLISFARKEDHPEVFKSRIIPLWRCLLDVWYELGIEIILQSTTPLSKTEELDEAQNMIQWTDGSFPTLIHGPFSQDALALYISLVFEVYGIIKQTFHTRDFINIARMFQKLILYHSQASSNATISRIKADAVNDLDTMTTCQSFFLDFICCEKLSFEFSDEIKEEVVLLLSDCILNPFIPFPSTISGENSLVKKHSFMAFTKKSLILLCSHIAKHHNLSLYESGSFKVALKSLSVPLKYKYSCPPISAKDSLPLYRAASSCMLSLLSESILVLSSLPQESNQDQLIEIYAAIVDIIEVNLLCGSISPYPTTSDQFLDDEKFQLSVLQFVEKVLISFFGKEPVPDLFSKRLVHILIKLSGYDFNAPPPILQLTKANDRIPFNAKLEVSGSSQLLVGPDVLSPQMEKAANTSLEILFRICSVDESATSNRVAQNSIPILIEKCRQVFVNYIHDRPISGKLPLPRSRNQELIIILKSLSVLHVYRPVLKDLDVPQIINKASVQAFLLSSDMFVLYTMYPILCELMGIVSSFEEVLLAELVLTCLKRIGSLFQGDA